MPKEDNRKIESNEIKITVTFDNNSFKKGLGTAWGFSCVIYGTEKTVLFDTGSDGLMLLDNMSKLQINPSDIDIVFLSHYHWDHVDGLDEFLKRNPNVEIYMPESFPKDYKEKVNSSGAEIFEVDGPQQIQTGVYSTGQMGQSLIEQSLILDTDKGLVLITGCAHPGIVETIRKAKTVLEEKIFLVMGGFHLKDSGKSEVGKIIEEFGKSKVQYVGPTHCSGDSARNVFKQNFNENYIQIGTGREVALKELKVY